MPRVKTTGCLVVCTAWSEPERTDFFFVLVFFNMQRVPVEPSPFILVQWDKRQTSYFLMEAFTTAMHSTDLEISSIFPNDLFLIPDE